MKTIYLIRHAESEGNAGLHFQGKQTGLTEQGRTQARFLAERCAHLRIDSIVSSSMSRATETAQIISDKIGLEFETSHIFCERKRPSLIVGISMQDIDAKRIDEEWTNSLLTGGARVHDGENFDDINERSEQALDFLANHPSENILVVSHGFFMSVLLAKIIFRENLTPGGLKHVFDIFHTSNTGISLIKHQSKWAEWEIFSWNDQSHLG